MSRYANKMTWSTMAIIASVFALLAANGSGESIFADTSLIILGSAFIGVMIVMTIASIDGHMRLSIQLLTIYFAIYLLLPGFSHSAVNRFPFFGFSYPLDIRITAAWMVAIFLVAIFASYGTALHSASLSPPPSQQLEGYHVRANVLLGAALTVISVISLIVFLDNVGLSGAFALRSATDNAGMEKASVGLGIGLPRTFTFLPVIYATLAIAYRRSKSFGWLLLSVNLPILLVVNFPLAIPRSQVFGNMLLFAMLLVDFRKPSNRILLSLAFVFGALVAMPLLDHFTRRGGTWAQIDLQRMLSVYFDTPDFDGFQSVNNAVIYVFRYGLEYGIQLLSAILFFIPRSIWTGKAEPTGTITSETAGYTFTNVSQPLPSELYVDFGWTGMLIAALLLGFIFYRLDRWLDREWQTDMRTRLVAGWMMGFGLPVYRGTLLGVLGPFIILAAGLWIITRFGMRRVRNIAQAPKDLADG